MINGLRDLGEIKAFLHTSCFQLLSWCFHPSPPAPNSPRGLAGGSSEEALGQAGEQPRSPHHFGHCFFPTVTRRRGCQHPPAEPKRCCTSSGTQLPQKLCPAKLQAEPAAPSREKEATGTANLSTAAQERGWKRLPIYISVIAIQAAWRGTGALDGKFRQKQRGNEKVSASGRSDETGSLEGFQQQKGFQLLLRAAAR